jgi:hypothetical protein
MEHVADRSIFTDLFFGYFESLFQPQRLYLIIRDDELSMTDERVEM